MYTGVRMVDEVARAERLAESMEATRRCIVSQRPLHWAHAELLLHRVEVLEEELASMRGPVAGEMAR